MPLPDGYFNQTFDFTDGNPSPAFKVLRDAALKSFDLGYYFFRTTPDNSSNIFQGHHLNPRNVFKSDAFRDFFSNLVEFGG